MSIVTMSKTHVRAGDLVKVISGNHRGSEGKVLQVLRSKGQVLIEGVRMIKKHVKRSQDKPNGAIIEREGPIHISNVKLLEKAAAQPKAGTKAKGEKAAKPAKTKAPKAE
jgi:large subunit ribosomal protein L24